MSYPPLVESLVLSENRYGVHLRVVVDQLVTDGTQQHQVVEVVEIWGAGLTRRCPSRPGRLEGNDVGGLAKEAEREGQRMLEEVDVVPVKLTASTGLDAKQHFSWDRNFSTDVYPGSSLTLRGRSPRDSFL
jgi:hypothetical protein